MKPRRALLLILLSGLLAVAGGERAGAQTVDELYREGVAARMEQRFKEAVSLLDRAKTLAPDNADVLVQLGFTQLALANNTAAREAFEQALAIAPSYEDARFGLAQIAFRSSDFVEARRLAAAVVGAQPDHAEAKQLLTSIEAAEKADQAEPPPAARAGPTSQPAKRAKPGPSRLETTLQRARKLREEGRFAEAETLYREALALSPGNADVLVALGLVAGFQQDFDEAERFFQAALEKAPDYLDARLGLARVALWHGDLAGARTLVSAVTAKYPDNTEARLLAARISLQEGETRAAEAQFQAILKREPDNSEALVGLGDAQRARGDDRAARTSYGKALALEPASVDIQQRLAQPPPKKWRTDIGTELSHLSGGRQSWTDSSVGLAYTPQPGTTIGGRTRVVTRYGETDVQIEARIDHAFSQDFSAYGIVAGTPDADFLARFSVGGGATWRAYAPAGAWGPLVLTLDGRHDIFADTSVSTVSPAAQFFFFDQKLGLQVRWIHSFNDEGTTANGYVLRADLAATDRFRILAGYSDAPEISEGTLVDTKTVFTGFSYDLSDALTLRGNYAYEHREAFDRNTFGLGLSVRF
ncbi:tetratricopeptide repeat protein [Mesorhizobium sp. ZC-5]|uniref:tetratricopeptide repeat protein n=1 Tax=Mesorhizobium sp. ZC-5 TaxID=2986066 RepID=UPI0021E973FF|nr:tetratricopeptide repeat protein [Mesorhizobium sp. ZC-5]MCV3238644.1 YaiO family outer membrane beta-barrel protein [Mesorhizobium sp. ZC-5]